MHVIEVNVQTTMADLQLKILDLHASAAGAKMQLTEPVLTMIDPYGMMLQNALNLLDKQVVLAADCDV